MSINIEDAYVNGVFNGFREAGHGASMKRATPTYFVEDLAMLVDKRGVMEECCG